MIQFTEEGASQTGLCFFDLDEDGRIAAITDFWLNLTSRRGPGAPGQPVLTGWRALTCR